MRPRRRLCQTQGLGTCEWDACQYSGQNQCLAVYGCAWNGSACAPATGTGACRAPLKRMVRNNATKVSILMSDEEDCYVKDGPNGANNRAAYDGVCTESPGGLLLYNDPVRYARTSAFLQLHGGARHLDVRHHRRPARHHQTATRSRASRPLTADASSPPPMPPPTRARSTSTWPNPPAAVGAPFVRSTSSPQSNPSASPPSPSLRLTCSRASSKTKPCSPSPPR